MCLACPVTVNELLSLDILWTSFFPSTRKRRILWWSF